MLAGYGSDGCIQGDRKRYLKIHQEMEEVGGLKISRKGEVLLGVDKKKKLFSETSNTVHQDRMLYALRY